MHAPSSASYGLPVVEVVVPERSAKMLPSAARDIGDLKTYFLGTALFYCLPVRNSPLMFQWQKLTDAKQAPATEVPGPQEQEHTEQTSDKNEANYSCSQIQVLLRAKLYCQEPTRTRYKSRCCNKTSAAGLGDQSSTQSLPRRWRYPVKIA